MSKFTLYCIGTVAEPKANINTAVIQVTLDEIHPLEDGDKISSQEKYTAYGEDRKGKSYRAEVSVDKTVDATWIRTGNRISAPDVVRGEKVEIYRYDNGDKFYWSETGIGDVFQQRKKETMILAVAAANSTEPKTEHDATNCYSAYISGHSRKAAIVMPKITDEQAPINVTLDGVNGIVAIEMGGIGKITISTAGGGTIRAETTAGGSIEIKQRDITLEFDKLTLNGSEANFNIGNTNWKGNLGHKGNIDSTGNIESTGNINNTGTIKSNGVSTDMHKHPGNNQPPIPGT